MNFCYKESKAKTIFKFFYFFWGGGGGGGVGGGVWGK